jgi:hypothetical protein
VKLGHKSSDNFEMAINPKVTSYVRQIQARVISCHHATLAIYSFAKNNIPHLPGVAKSGFFALQLERSKNEALPYPARKAVPPHLYEVFAFFDNIQTQAQALVHTAIVVDAGPRVRVADHDFMNARIRLRPLPDFFERWKGFDAWLFPAEVVERCNDLAGLVDHYGPFPIYHEL